MSLRIFKLCGCDVFEMIPITPLEVRYLFIVLCWLTYKDHDGIYTGDSLTIKTEIVSTCRRACMGNRTAAYMLWLTTYVRSVAGELLNLAFSGTKGNGPLLLESFPISI
ncbi:hypothetical protein AVEN_59876-1 [Araneus ventricosus]|uniref:Uncharacterized protein n=1 Tax=Araneus ventricosus TaxID=182803 RepID=A0A4Y2GV31_ARAVE|nr:hypothetical protein AVEN_59876-1 [Araneus ventricosus]